MPKIEIPDVVVLIPGITGSVLARDGKEVWAPTPGAVLRGLLRLRHTLKKLEVTDDDWRADDLGDGVVATKLVDAAHIIPGFWKIDVYNVIEQFLLSTCTLTAGQNYFPFPYDWRRDNRASARLLAKRSKEWLSRWRDSSGKSQAQLVLVGHSMGGLVARYFVEALGGWRDTKAVITFGTPFYGSLNALDFLVNGFSKSFGPLNADLSPLLRSMTSVHQLVPSYRCVYLAEGDAVTPADGELPQWQPSWDDQLREFQQETEEAAAANREDPGFAASPVMYRPITGRDQPTRQSARVEGGTVTVVNDRGGSDESGDGTVPLLSAALSGTENQRTFVPEQHSRLQCSGPMLQHLAGVLQSLHQIRIDDLRDQVTSWFSLDVDDLFLPGEPASVRLAALSALDVGSLPEVETTLTVNEHATGTQVVQRTLIIPRETSEIILGELPPGTYTINVAGGQASAPVSDIFAVAAPEELAD
jgi:pimeloyl-ACP methyl ester carboxylesterase